MDLVISKTILNSANMSPQELSVDIAVMLYKKEKLSLGQASKLANMDQIRFQQLLARKDISLHYDVADFEEDLQTLKQLGRL